MKRSKYFILGFLLALALTSTGARAELKNGATAPDFTAEASLGGKTFTFKLEDALQKGPVVLYFYPAAFTSGCTMEAHDFAEAMDDFKAHGATVIGISHDSIETLTKFSVSECGSKFAVGSDQDGDIMKSYDAVMTSLLGLAARVSYVITPDGKIYYSYKDSDPSQHVANTLHALDEWQHK